MSSTIKIKRSNTSGNAPDTNNIVEGELALNTADGVLYSRGGDDIFEVGSNLTTADIDALVVNDSAQIDGKLEVSPSTASDTISLGSTTQTGTITLGQSTQTNTIDIGSAATANNRTQNINIGKNAAGNSGQKKIVVGVNTSPTVGGSSTTELQGETTIQQIAPNISLPTGDNSITSITSSGKYAKIAEIAMTQSGEFYNAKFQCFFTSNDTNLPSSEIALSIYCRGVGTGTQNPLIDMTSTANDRYAQSGEPHPEFSIRLESDDNGVMKFHVFGRIMVEGLGMEIFFKEQTFSDNVSVSYTTTILETNYLDQTGFGNFGETSYTTNESRIHTTSSWHWDTLFGDDPGIIRTTGGRSPNSIQSVNRAGGFLHYDSDTFTFSHTYNIASSDNSVPITIGNDDSASTTILQGVTKIDRLGSKIKTPTGDNGISSITTVGKLMKILTIDTTTSDEYYNLTLDTYSRGAVNSYNGDRLCPTRSFLSVTSQGIGTTPSMSLLNSTLEAPYDREDHPELAVNVNTDVAGDGSGPCRVEVYQRIYIPGSGVESFVISENGTAGIATWEETFAETDYQSYSDVSGMSDYQFSSSNIAYILSTRSDKFDHVFGTTAGILRTTGGDGVEALGAAVAQSEGFLFYDSADETFSHTFDMLPSDPLTSITIGDSNGTGPISLGTSKLLQGVNINSGVGTTSSCIKQTNISTGQTNGSCDINIGPTSSTPTSLVDILGTVNIAGNRNNDSITLGQANQSGNINLGIATVTNTLKVNNGATAALSAKVTKIGGNGALGSTETLELGYNNQASANSTIKIGNEGSATNKVQIHGDVTFDNGDFSMDSGHDFDIGSTARIRMVNIESVGSGTRTNLLSKAGSRIIYTESSTNTDQTWNDFTPGNDDVGRIWTLINASTGNNSEINLAFTNQYMRFMDGGSNVAQKANWTIGRGGMAEIICVGAVISGGSSTTPNFIIYGSGIGHD